MKRSIETDTRVRFVVLMTALAVAATLAPAFAQSSKIALREVRLEPTAPSPTAHDQFGFVTAMSANGQTLAIGATTTDQGTISEDGAVLIFDRVQDQWVQTARLFPSDGTDDEQSASNVAITRDRLYSISPIGGISPISVLFNYFIVSSFRVAISLHSYSRGERNQ